MTSGEIYILADTPDSRLSILRVGGLIYVHSNDRVLGFDPAAAEQLCNGLRAVLSGTFDRAATESELQLEITRLARRSAPTGNPPPAPTLDTL